MRLIDAHGLDILGYLEEFPACENDKAWNAAIREVCIYVNLAPTVDAVPVVRCKDCKLYRVYMGRSMCAKNAQILDNHEVGLCATGKDDFCSYGERKENKI